MTSQSRHQQINLASFRKRVYEHYRRFGRRLPWRLTTDPYKILVSEVMLQQTQAGRVVSKYQEFTEAFPTIESLAQAPLTDILARWQGLGYNRRAVALKNIAMRVVSEFSAKVPEDPRILETFPCIGPNTAASIVAFAFNKPVVFIETNIRTVFIRHFFPDTCHVSDDIIPLLRKSLKGQNPRSWYNALMDYGAYLKKLHGNLNQKSTMYRKQTPFNGSKRQVRGKILRMFIGTQNASVPRIGRWLKLDQDYVRGILYELEREGFLRSSGKRYFLA